MLFFGLANYAQKPIVQIPLPTAEIRAFTINKIFPNPVKDHLNVDLRLDEGGSVQISLISIIGTEVKKWENIQLNQGDQILKLDLSGFQSGMYFLKIAKSGQAKSLVLKKI
jgi:hypothetical protein